MVRAVGGALGGGGGGALALLASFSACAFSSCFFCSMYSLMKSAFSSIWSSVMPIANSSFNSGCHEGSLVSMAELLALVALEWLLCEGDTTLMAGGGIMDCVGGAGFEECLWPNNPPRRPWP